MRWFFAPKPVQWLPFQTRFASGNWAPQKIRWPGVGEVAGAERRWSNGRTPPSLRRNHYCGTEAMLAEGALESDPVLDLDIRGTPLCCLDADPQGVVIDGDAIFSHAYHTFIAEGGITLDGVAEFVPYHQFDGGGGVVLGGVSIFTMSPHTFQAGGGVLVDGTSTFIEVHVFWAEGGILTDGTSEMGPVQRFYAEGGVLVDGASSFAHVVQAEGGVLVDGSAAINPPTFHADGGVLADGTTSSVVYGCSTFGPSPQYYGLTIVVLPSCDFWSDTYSDLLYGGAGCQWQDNLSAPRNSVLLFVSGSVVKLQFRNSSFIINAEYRLATSSWVPFGVNTMSLFSEGGACSGTFPATVDVHPV